MNWFGILKKDKVLPKMREFQFAGEGKNKPEVEDDRCRKRLKEKFLKLKVRNDHMISGNKWHGDIKTDSYRTISWDNNETRKVYTRGSEGVDKFVEALDDVSEEMCCGILEAIQEMAVKGRDWYTTQLENLNQGEGYSAVDFPDYQKSIPIKTSKGDENTYVSLSTNFYYANRMHFTIHFSRNRGNNDHFNENSDAAHGIMIKYTNTDADGFDLGRSYEHPKWNVNNESENLEVRVPRNLILFMNFILSMGE